MTYGKRFVHPVGILAQAQADPFVILSLTSYSMRWCRKSSTMDDSPASRCYNLLLSFSPDEWTFHSQRFSLTARSAVAPSRVIFALYHWASRMELAPIVVSVYYDRWKTLISGRANHLHAFESNRYLESILLHAVRVHSKSQRAVPRGVQCACLRIQCSVPLVRHLIQVVESHPYLSGTPSTHSPVGRSFRMVKVILTFKLT